MSHLTAKKCHRIHTSSFVEARRTPRARELITAEDDAEKRILVSRNNLDGRARQMSAILE